MRELTEIRLVLLANLFLSFQCDLARWWQPSTKLNKHKMNYCCLFCFYYKTVSVGIGIFLVLNYKLQVVIHSSSIITKDNELHFL